jgi:hypothetical protein
MCQVGTIKPAPTAQDHPLAILEIPTRNNLNTITIVRQAHNNAASTNCSIRAITPIRKTTARIAQKAEASALRFSFRKRCSLFSAPFTVPLYVLHQPVID